MECHRDRIQISLSNAVSLANKPENFEKRVVRSRNCDWRFNFPIKLVTCRIRDFPASARVAKLVDARDLKSLGHCDRAGSIPAPGTITFLIFRTDTGRLNSLGWFYRRTDRSHRYHHSRSRDRSPHHERANEALVVSPHHRLVNIHSRQRYSNGYSS